MSSSLRASLDAIKQSSSILNGTADEAAELVVALEDYLSRSCGAGVTLHVSAGKMAEIDPDEPDGETEVFLGYARIGGKYRITITTRIPGENVSEESAWADFDRTTKLATIPYLPELVDRLATLMNVRAARVQESTKSVIEEIKKQIPKGVKK